MKRVWVVWAILAGVVAACIFGVVSTHSATTGMTELLRQVEEEIQQGNHDQALRLSRDAQKKWHGYHRVLCTFLGHERLESIDRDLSVLPVYVAHGEDADAAAQCAQLQEAMKQMKSAEIPALENIL